ncbi:hypothetical protein [Romboutsia ilealis]|uniref:hypothetical protein n=1 Tax=Romboutsia ilealis TaxID=1115758 RepID=UPI0026F39F98|nr:hypothetical protein [Romboutsia ilealis]
MAKSFRNRKERNTGEKNKMGKGKKALIWGTVAFVTLVGIGIAEQNAEWEAMTPEEQAQVIAEKEQAKAEVDAKNKAEQDKAEKELQDKKDAIAEEKTQKEKEKAEKLAKEQVEKEKKTAKVDSKKEDTSKDTPKVVKTLNTEYLQSVLKSDDFKSLKVTYESEILDITLDVVDNFTTDMMLRSNGNNIKSILESIKNTGLLKDTDTVKISFMGNTMDKLGNENTGAWIMVSYDGNIVNQANYQNLFATDIYKLSNTVGMLPDIRQDIKANGDFSFLK